MKTKRPILFDLDGTLWDTRAAITESWNNTFEANGHGRPVTVENLSPLVGKTMDAFRLAYLPNMPEELGKQFMKIVEEKEVEDLSSGCESCVYEGVIETLRCLAKDHWLGIVSNCQCGYIEDFLIASGLDDVIQAHLCYGQTLTSKGQSILRVIQEHNLENACYVGDTFGDQSAAKEAGIDFIWAEYGFGTNVEKKGIQQISDLTNDPYFVDLLK